MTYQVDVKKDINFFNNEIHDVEISDDSREEVTKPKFVIYLGNDQKS